MLISPIFILTFSLVVSKAHSQTGKITGTVSYYFNDNYGFKTDVGADIYFLSSNDLDNSDIITLYDWHLERILPSMSKTDIDELDKKTYNIWNIIREKAIYNNNHVLADGNGNFMKNLEAGNYFVFVQSANRQSERNYSRIESFGLIHIDFVELEEGKEKFVGVKFLIR